MSYCTDIKYCVDITADNVAEAFLIRTYLDIREMDYSLWMYRVPTIIEDGKERELRPRISFDIRFRNCDELQNFLRYMKTRDAHTMVMNPDADMWISYDSFLGCRDHEKYGYWRFTRKIA